MLYLIKQGRYVQKFQLSTWLKSISISILKILNCNLKFISDTLQSLLHLQAFRNNIEFRDAS